MTFEFTSLFFVRLLSGLLALALVIVLWKRRDLDGVIFLILFEFAAALWTITEGLEHAATQISLKILMSQIGYIGSSTTTVFFLLFTLSYTQFLRKFNPGIIWILLIIPAITIVLVFTNSFHHLIWTNIELFPATNESVYTYGKWFWFYSSFEYSVFILSIVVLLLSTFRFYSIYKTQLIYIIIAAVLPLITSILYVFKLTPLKADITPVALIFSGILGAFGIFRQRMFDVVPVARRQTINNLTDGIIVVDLADRIVDVNLAFCRMINANLNDLIGNPFKRFSHLFLDDGSAHSDINEFLTETTIRTINGLKHFEVKYSPVTNSKQKLIGRIFVLHDISIRKRALDAAVESNAQLRNEIIEKERLIAELDAYAHTVAHDLKNPISGVIGLTEFITEDIRNQQLDQAIELLTLLNDQGHTMLKIVDELLLLSKIRREDIQLVDIDMHSTVKEAINRLKFQIQEREATFELPDRWINAKGHPQWLEEVWANLISNAIKYGGNPPRVVIGNEQMADGRIRFTVQDNGAGLSPEMVEKLFMDFERLGQKNIEGHGLGLSITKRIIEKLGGEVAVTSENLPGKGCTFCFTLANPPAK